MSVARKVDNARKRLQLYAQDVADAVAVGELQTGLPMARVMSRCLHIAHQRYFVADARPPCRFQLAPVEAVSDDLCHVPAADWPATVAAVQNLSNRWLNRRQHWTGNFMGAFMWYATLKCGPLLDITLVGSCAPQYWPDRLVDAGLSIDDAHQQAQQLYAAFVITVAQQASRSFEPAVGISKGAT